MWTNGGPGDELNARLEELVFGRGLGLVHPEEPFFFPCWQQAASILTTIGVLEEPLGNARLHGARLVAALLHTNTPMINQELCRLNTMDVLLVRVGRGQAGRAHWPGAC